MGVIADILIGFVVLYVLSLIGTIFYFWKGWNRWFYHDIMEWHRPKDVVGFDGCSFTTMEELDTFLFRCWQMIKMVLLFTIFLAMLCIGSCLLVGA